MGEQTYMDRSMQSSKAKPTAKKRRFRLKKGYVCAYQPTLSDGQTGRRHSIEPPLEVDEGDERMVGQEHKFEVIK